MPRPEIIQVNPAAHLCYRRDIRHDHIIVRIRHHGFQHFHRQPVG